MRCVIFKDENGNWVEYRKLPDLLELDFHCNDGYGFGSYWENMNDVADQALAALRRAQEEGKAYVLFTHGSSTSRIGKTTARSQVRKVMRSKDATPYIIRSQCIQHYSVFVAAVRPKQN